LRALGRRVAVVLIAGHLESGHGSLHLCVLLLPFDGGQAAATGAHVRADDSFPAAADKLRLWGRGGLIGFRALRSECGDEKCDWHGTLPGSKSAPSVRKSMFRRAADPTAHLPRNGRKKADAVRISQFRAACEQGRC